ncbi:MAG: peroxisome assembly protein (Peroxin-2) [Sclerophora amabilis]|nr:MAG: peroxisome assembly protein (Peroxin-2) [Sclerophora amabilis]
MTSTDFSAAQQRLANRRRLREAEVQARLSQQSPPQARLPSPLHRVERASRDFWFSVRGREGTKPVFRVGQVDAELLDEELLELLKAQVGDALKFYGSHLKDDWSAEILLALRAVLFKLSIWDHNATYGAALQNLRYSDARNQGPVYASPSRWQKALYGLFTVGGKYAWTKWEDYLVDQESNFQEPSQNFRSLSRLTAQATTAHSFAAFASFLVFLVNGRYRTVLDRILHLRLTPPTSHVSREVSFEYLNRQLVWHAFTEFLLFVLPLVGIKRWRRWLARAWRKTISMLRRGGNESEEGLELKGELSYLPERTCAICYQDQNPNSTSENEVLAVSGASSGVIGSAQTDVTNPYETIPCGCIYCFVCLAQRLDSEEGEGWVCLRCGEVVKECRPWKGDVVEEVNKSATAAKSVGFSVDGVDERKKQGFEEQETRGGQDGLEEKELVRDAENEASISKSGVDESGHWEELGDGSPSLENRESSLTPDGEGSAGPAEIIKSE